MSPSSVTFDRPTLLLNLGQPFRSMLELDLALFSVLKKIQTSVKCDAISVWLLDEAETELSCTHAVGLNAGNLIGALANSRKFVSSYRAKSVKRGTTGDLPLSKWMSLNLHREYFNSGAKNICIKPLVTRGELIGVIIALRKIGKSSFNSRDRGFIQELSAQIAVAIQNTKLFEQKNRTHEHQNLHDQISRHLHQTLDLDELIPRVFTEVNKAINAEAQSIWLVDEEAKVIKCLLATGPESESLKGFSMPLTAPSIVGSSVSGKKSIMIKDAQHDPRRARSADERTGFVTRSLLTVPLVLEDKAIGAIQAVNKRGGELFNQDDLALFRSIADSAALAVNNAQLVAELQNSYDLTLDALSAALDLRDRETEGHSRRVVEYTGRLAEQIGLDKETIKSIRRGALIHDIGKIGVPDAVLLKPGSLTSKERNIINRHPQAGYDMLAGIPYLREEIKIVICHQEKWDGTGYPFGLRGEEISMGARLFAIADTFDALTSDRPYRQSRSYETARRIIQKQSGKQFDPQAVAAFLAVPAEEWTQIRTRVMAEIKRRHELKT